MKYVPSEGKACPRFGQVLGGPLVLVGERAVDALAAGRQQLHCGTIMFMSNAEQCLLRLLILMILLDTKLRQ